MAMIERPIIVDPLDLGEITASTEAAGFPASNLNRRDTMGLVWQTAASGGWVRGQFAATEQVDFLAIINANALPGTTYRLRLGASQAEVDGSAASYDSGALLFISPAYTRKDGLYHSFLRLPAAVGALWWRIDIANQAGTFEAAAVVLGKAIEPTRYYDKDFERGIEDLGALSMNRYGVPDKVSGLKLRTLLFTLSWLSEAEHEDTFAPLAHKVGTTEILYCCFDPAATAWRQNRTYLGFLGRAPFARGGAKPRNMAMELQFRSLV